MKPLLLGERPGRGDGRPLESLAPRLLGFAGIPYDDAYAELTARFDVMNAQPEAGPFGLSAAGDRWVDYLLHLPPDDALTVVCLGRNAAATVGLRRPWGEWLEVGLLRAVVTPHPSTRNRLYNDPEMRTLAGRALRAALDGATFGRT